MLTRTLRILAIASTLTALCGCGQVTNQLFGADDGAGASAIESANLSSVESALVVSGFDAADPTKTVDQIALDVATAAKNQFTPADCVLAGAEGPIVTYQLNNCTGPYGLVNVSGTVGVTYEVSGSSVTSTMVATDLEANGGVMTIQATSVLTIDGTTRTAAISTNGVGTTRAGDVLGRVGAYDVTWDNAAGCINLDGSWTTTVGDVAWVTAVSTYERCGNTCPKSGANIVYTSSEGRVISVSFQGGATALVTASDANDPTNVDVNTLNLSCTPN